MPLKFIHGDTGYTSDAIEAIEYAMNMRIKIINCSFGGTDNNPALKFSMENSGILFVCAAGNIGTDISNKAIYPAAFELPNVISVTAIDSKGVLSKFSSYGDQVDVAAPGSNILSTIPIERGNETKTHNYTNGTSASAAIVSGIAALVQSTFADDNILGIKNRILEGIVACSILEGKIGTTGRVDAYAALTGVKQSKDDYIGGGNDNTPLPIEGGEEDDSWYVLDERATDLERLHYGKSGVYPPSGNYSVTCTDVTLPSSAYDLNLNRTYNSKSTIRSILGIGWTFGFQGSVVLNNNIAEVYLPDGSIHFFEFIKGAYVGKGTRSTFVVSGSTYLLTMQDQVQYEFNSSKKIIYYH